MNTKLLKSFLILLFLLIILYIVRVEFYLSWTTWWFDPILHFLAGGLIGLSVLLVIQKFLSVNSPNFLRTIFIAITVAFLLGVVWEIYELYIGNTSLSDGWIYVADTASDLILDICGGFFGALYGLKLKN